MATKGQMFFVGVGTTFAILSMGFGGGLLLANSALHEAPMPKRAAVESPVAARVVLPTSEQPPVQFTPVAPAEKTASVTPTPQIPPQVTPAKTDDERRVAETSKQEELAWRKKSALAAERASQRKAKEAAIKRRQQYAQQIARRELARAKQQQDLQSDTNRRESGLLAFGTDDQPTASGFFGN